MEETTEVEVEGRGVVVQLVLGAGIKSPVAILDPPVTPRGGKGGAAALHRFSFGATKINCLVKTAVILVKVMIEFCEEEIGHMKVGDGGE